ncbi:hypothetical protein F5887DRAFT_248216 [Amanita rubescens]|nr:hypothetical protein F5887DRAFT_248216 [Amanita rubescens]
MSTFPVPIKKTRPIWIIPSVAVSSASPNLVVFSQLCHSLLLSRVDIAPTQGMCSLSKPFNCADQLCFMTILPQLSYSPHETPLRPSVNLYTPTCQILLPDDSYNYAGIPLYPILATKNLFQLCVTHLPPSYYLLSLFPKKERLARERLLFATSSFGKNTNIATWNALHPPMIPLHPNSAPFRRVTIPIYSTHGNSRPKRW